MLAGGGTQAIPRLFAGLLAGTVCEHSTNSTRTTCNKKYPHHPPRGEKKYYRYFCTRTRPMAKFLALLCPALVAASADDDAFNFLVMGDWGGIGKPPYTTPEEVATAVRFVI